MRRLVAAALLLGALGLPGGLRAQTITVAPGGEMSSLVNVPFDVPIYVDMTQRTEKLGSFALRMSWDTTVLRFVSGSNGTFGAVTANADSIPRGVLRLTGANPAGLGGMVTVEIAHFMPVAAQSDTVVLSVSQLYAAGTFADLTASMAVQARTAFCPARGMFGDMDKDGAINSRDALIALSNAVGLDVSAFDVTLGDVDANGVTNARDALIILSYSVGLNVGGYRVDRIAGGSCAVNVPLVMAILPDTADLVVGQTVAFEARAADSSGVPKTVTDAIWRSSNSGALALFPDGTALARDTGSVWVTAVRGTLDSARALVRIVAHRSHLYVDAGAANARNQLGSAAFPFARINQGIAYAQDGDTVEVRAGRYNEGVWLNRAAVLIGDTLADGTRPLIAGPDTTIAGIQLTGRGARVVHDFAIDGFDEGVDVAGADAVVLHGLRVTGVSYGVYVSLGPVGSLRLEASHLIGSGASSSEDGVYAETTTPVDSLVLQDGEISDFGGDGVYAPGADSIAVLRSRIHDVAEYGIAAGPNAGDCYDCAAPQRAIGRGPPPLGPSLGFAMDSSALLSGGFGGAYLDGIRSAALTRSVLANPGFAVEVYGLPGGWVRFSRDSIVQSESESYWLEAQSLDSLSLDSTSVQVAYGGGYVFGVPMVRVTRSQFLGVQGTALYVGGPSGNGVVTLDSVSIVGNPACDLCGTGFSLGNERVTANRLSLSNLYEGIHSYGDSSLTVTNSFFHHIEYPIEWSGSETDSTSRLVVGGTSFLGFYDAIAAYDGGLRVDSSSFANGSDEGVYFNGTGPVRVAGNTFAGVQWAIDVEPNSTYGPWVDTVGSNTVSDASGEGIEIYADDSVPFRVLGNSVACSGSGGYGIDLEYASGVVGGNHVTGCEYGIDVYDDGGPVMRADTVFGNSVAMPAGSSAGIYVEGSIRSRVARDTVAGDTTSSGDAGDIYVYGYQPGATATMDSNTVTGGSATGIYYFNLDTAMVRFNAVRGVRGIGIFADGGLTYLAQIYGNGVRNVYGSGIDVYQNDSAMMTVDSNVVDSSTVHGIVLEGGADSVTRNAIVTNDTGVVFTDYPNVDQARTLVSGNNIVGNVFGLAQNLDALYQAPNNWWGDPNGPRCLSEACISSTAGDSVTYGGVNYTPFATSAFGNVPAPAAPARPLVALGPAAVRAVRAPAPTGLDAPVAKQSHATRPALAALTVVPRAGSVRAVAPRNLSRARAQAWQRHVQLDAARVQATLQRHAAMGAGLARFEAARAALEQHEQQRKAQLEARLKVKQERQAAARAAHTHGVRQ